MKKILTLLLALWMLTGCVAMAAENQLVVGSTTAMSGAFFTDLFGSNTADIDLLLSGEVDLFNKMVAADTISKGIQSTADQPFSVANYRVTENQTWTQAIVGATLTQTAE